MDKEKKEPEKKVSVRDECLGCEHLYFCRSCHGRDGGRLSCEGIARGKPLWETYPQLFRVE